MALDTLRKQHARERVQLLAHQREEMVAKRAHQKAERQTQRAAQKREVQEVRNTFRVARRPKGYARQAFEEDYEG